MVISLDYVDTTAVSPAVQGAAGKASLSGMTGGSNIAAGEPHRLDTEDIRAPESGPKPPAGGSLAPGYWSAATRVTIGKGAKFTQRSNRMGGRCGEFDLILPVAVIHGPAIRQTQNAP